MFDVLQDLPVKVVTVGVVFGDERLQQKPQTAVTETKISAIQFLQYGIFQF